MTDFRSARLTLVFVSASLAFAPSIASAWQTQLELEIEPHSGLVSDVSYHLDDASIDTASTPSPAVTPDCACTTACDCKAIKKVDTAAASAHKTLFYENDFSYLCDPCYLHPYLGDFFKRRALGSRITYDVGGQYRARHHSERNMKPLGLTGNDDDFLLHRARIFGNVEVGDSLRFYAEYIDAVSNYENFPPRPIDENRSDMLNLFVDGLLLTGPVGDLSARVGRQEMIFGVQRVISPLDWANTRRTFDGAKLMLRNECWDIDAFWTRPVLVNKTRFDNPILDQQFYGITSKYKGFGDDNAEMYWLAFDDDATGLRVDSLGGRYLGTLDNWMVEGWGNYQFGKNANDSDRSAGAITLGLGRKMDHCWKPQVWAYFDWASGSATQGSGNGHFQFFPLAHKYLGFMDFFARENIQTPNLQMSVQPTEKLKILAWYYYFMLADGSDGPYNVNNSAFQPGVAPGSRELGHEIDLLLSYKLGVRSNLNFGYSHFFTGDYYDTPGLPFSGDADFFYTEFTINF